MKASIVTQVVAVLFLAGCAHPRYVATTSADSAVVEFHNGSAGSTQQYFFADPVSCKGPSVIAPLDSRASTTVRLPAGQPITIWTSAFGLPAPVGMIAWCRPSAFSTRLVAGATYRVEFVADENQGTCGAVLTSSDGKEVVQIARSVDGPEIAGGPLTKSFSCSPSDDLSSVLQ